MRIAVVCDDLIQFGGAEQVVMDIMNLYPRATLYTSVISKKWQKALKSKNISFKYSFLQKFPFIEALNEYYSAFLLHILAFESFDFTEYDLVISVSARYAHFVITKPQTKHICYMNSPGRMFWEPFDYFEHTNYRILNIIRWLAPPFLSVPLSIIRVSDYIAAQRVDTFISNSAIPRNRIKKYFGREADVIYPAINTELFTKPSAEVSTFEAVGVHSAHQNTLPYFLVISRLVPWKKIDVAVESCTKLKLPLKVVGVGSDLARLKRMAGSTIEFLGYVSIEEKIKLLKNCTALIFPQHEDFGLVPLEAMAAGKPVIAYGAGGVLETVVSSDSGVGKTGVFFSPQAFGGLIPILQKFNPKEFSPTDCINRAKLFDKKVFNRKFGKLCEKCCILEGHTI